jgi:tetratricopeptide (TPR) repeat protein
MAEKHRSRKEFNSAEWEYHTALKIDPDSIRANFGVGTLYMEMGQADKARDIFKKLSQIEAIFEEENKHIFNEFGIQLRKASMADEALANYLKAIEISPQDENLYFNVARLYYDSKDWENAMRWIEKSLSINEYFHEARQFEGVIRRALKEQGGGSLQDSGTGSPSADRPAEASPETPKG